MTREEFAQHYYSPVISLIRKRQPADLISKYPQFFAKKPPNAERCLHDRLLVSSSISNSLMHKLHKGNLHMKKMRSLVLLMCWWPKGDASIHETAKDFRVCVHQIHCQSKSQNRRSEICFPWKLAHANFFGPFPNRYHGLVSENSYSKRPELFLTSTLATSFVI